MLIIYLVCAGAVFLFPIVASSFFRQSALDAMASFFSLLPGIRSFAEPSPFPTVVSSSIGIALGISALIPFIVLLFGDPKAINQELKNIRNMSAVKRVCLGIAGLIFGILPWVIRGGSFYPDRPVANYIFRSYPTHSISDCLTYPFLSLHLAFFYSLL